MGSLWTRDLFSRAGGVLLYAFVETIPPALPPGHPPSTSNHLASAPSLFFAYRTYLRLLQAAAKCGHIVSEVDQPFLIEVDTVSLGVAVFGGEHDLLCSEVVIRVDAIAEVLFGTYILESLRCKNVFFDHFVNMDMLTLMSERHRNDPR